MKIVLLSLILSSCSLGLLDDSEPSIATQVHKCVVNLIGKHGVEAQKANEVCKSIYKQEG